MLLRLLRRSFYNQKKAMALMVASVAMGTAIAASLITLSLEITGKVSKELRAFGANILVEPKVEGLASVSGQQRCLREEDIIKTKTIFWRHNIVGIAPFLDAKLKVMGKPEPVMVVGTWFEKELPLPGESKRFPVGVKTVAPWWNVDGQWPDPPEADESGEDALIGVAVSKDFSLKQGDEIIIEDKKFRVSGILDTGGKEDNQVFVNLEVLQEMMSLQNKVSRILISALTTPMDDFAYKDPDTMSRLEYEKWYCTGYVTSIAKQVEEVFQGSRAKPIWQVAETEGKVLEKLKFLIYLLSLIALLASALGVSTTMIMSLLRRIEEIGLMKSIGADSIKIITVFLSEGVVIGFIGGLLGYGLSIMASRFIGIQVFGTGFEQRALLLPVAIGSALLISITGSLLPIRRALKIKSAVVLKGAQ